MLENTSHRCRWHENPAQRPPRPTLWDRLRTTIRRRKEGRKRIDPDGYWGHWSNGFHDAKKPR